MPSGFTYRSGPCQFKKRVSTASTAIVPGDAVGLTSGKLVVQATGYKNEGVAQATKLVGDAATTSVLVLRPLTGRTTFRAYEKRATGSLAATNEGGQCDISGASGAMGFDSSSNSKGDVYLSEVLKVGASNVAIASIAFADPAWVTTSVAAT